MMTLLFLLFAVNAFLLLRKPRRTWPLVLIVVVALVLGAVVFVRDVDFSTDLGIQL